MYFLTGGPHIKSEIRIVNLNFSTSSSGERFSVHDLWAETRYEATSEDCAPYPPVPNPILKSQVAQSMFSLLTKPILALEASLSLHTTLNPSLLQLVCKEAC